MYLVTLEGSKKKKALGGSDGRLSAEEMRAVAAELVKDSGAYSLAAQFITAFKAENSTVSSDDWKDDVINSWMQFFGAEKNSWGTQYFNIDLASFGIKNDDEFLRFVCALRVLVSQKIISPTGKAYENITDEAKEQLVYVSGLDIAAGSASRLAYLCLYDAYNSIEDSYYYNWFAGKISDSFTSKLNGFIKEFVSSAGDTAQKVSDALAAPIGAAADKLAAGAKETAQWLANKEFAITGTVYSGLAAVAPIILAVARPQSKALLAGGAILSALPLAFAGNYVCRHPADLETKLKWGGIGVCAGGAVALVAGSLAKSNTARAVGMAALNAASGGSAGAAAKIAKAASAAAQMHGGNPLTKRKLSKGGKSGFKI